MAVGNVSKLQTHRETGDSFGWLQCSVCSKWRRVTAAAVKVWGEPFHKTHVDRCKHALTQEEWLYDVCVSTTSFEAFTGQVTEWAQHRSESLCVRTSLLAALEILHERGEHKFDTEYQNALNAYPGAKFQCDELVGCVCAMACATSALQQASVDVEAWQGKPVLCVDTTSAEVFCGIASAYAKRGQALVGACQACEQGTRSYKAALDGARNQHDVLEIAPLCKKHQHVLHDAARKRRCKRLRFAAVRELLGDAFRDESVRNTWHVSLWRDGTDQALSLALTDEGSWRNATCVDGVSYKSYSKRTCLCESPRHKCSSRWTCSIAFGIATRSRATSFCLSVTLATIASSRFTPITNLLSNSTFARLTPTRCESGTNFQCAALVERQLLQLVCANAVPFRWKK